MLVTWPFFFSNLTTNQMGTSNFSSFLLFTFISLLLFFDAYSKTHWQDLQVLKQLKNCIDPGTIKPGSCLSSWDFNFDPCDSSFSDKFTCGIRCDVVESSYSRVTELGLDQAGYYSTSLNYVYWNLPYLQRLDLSGNYFSGEIPNSFSNLSQVQQIVLSRNSLSGWIPDSFGVLTNLEELYLDNNKLQGEIPLSFNRLQNLKRLDIQDNQLTGVFPQLSQLSNLNYLDASNNGISGVLPAAFPPALIELSMRNNKIVGNIPDSLIGLTYLQVLDLSHNQLTGSVPASLFTHPSLEQVTLSYNKFGSIQTPWNAGLVSQLIAVDLNDNLIHGYLPFFLVMLPKLSALSLENNHLSGLIPAQYALRILFPGQGFSPLSRLLLGGNYLIGPIPGQLFSLQPGSVNLRLGNNCFYRCPLRYFFCDGGEQKSWVECKGF